MHDTPEMNLLDDLNTGQAEAVGHLNGPLLVLAGAGTGKTRVLTTRIANLIRSKTAMPHEVLAVTFTNKAAKEMRERLQSMLGAHANDIWLGTFHAIAARILRRHADKVGLGVDFSIIDYDDQIRLAKKIVRDLALDEKHASPKLLLYLINKLKDKGLHYDSVPASEKSGFFQGKVEELYKEYQERLRRLNAVDFGDLILYNLRLFNEHDEITKFYQNRLRYILVDEYQDTNIAQYLWIRLLAQAHNQLCCVGDDDQSIYGWRGAEVTNILRFDKDFPQAKIVRLEQNYRSTGHILNVASKIIANNVNRHNKSIWADVAEGEKVRLNYFYDDREEAKYIADEIERLQSLHSCSLSNMAILVRAGFQTRSFEEIFNFMQIPYKIVGGMKFYERAEIKDVVSYIRLFVKTDDNLAFERIINVPKRGVGATTLNKIFEAAKKNQCSYFRAAEILAGGSGIRPSKAIASIGKFVKQMCYLRDTLQEYTNREAVESILKQTGYMDMWRDQGTTESKDRIDNIKELLRTLDEFESLPEYLEHISLVTDIDNTDNESRVSIMTMHAAKGLEFETVFLPGWEEGVFPSGRTIEESGQQGLEEERRLAYVAITRAKHRLYISYACNRRTFGHYQSAIPSRFIAEIPTRECDSETTVLMRDTPKAKTTSPTVAFNAEPAVVKSGEQVFHQKFGYGFVVKLEADIAEVVFENVGTKRIITDYLKTC